VVAVAVLIKPDELGIVIGLGEKRSDREGEEGKKRCPRGREGDRGQRGERKKKI
jgi:hypothetical protein